MRVVRLLYFLLVIALAASAHVTAQEVIQECGGYSGAPTVGFISTIGDQQGSSYYLVQVCGLAPGASILINLLVQDYEYENTLFSGQAPTDANGVAHINITGLTVPNDSSGEADAFQTVTSPGNPTVFYSTVSSVNNSIYSLAGQFVFQFQGVTTKDSQPVQIVGTYLADQQGHISGGEADLNTADGVMEKVALTGSYTYNATTSHEVVTLATPLGDQSFQVAFTGGSYSNNEGAMVSSAGPLFGTGKLTQTNPLSISPAFLYGSYALEFSGTLPCDFVCRLFGGARTIAGTGIFCLGCQPASQPDGEPMYSIVSDEIVANQPSIGTTQSGESGPVDPFHRFVLTNSASSSDGMPTRYAAYADGYSEMYLISLNPHDRRAAVSGIATQVNP